MRFWVGGVLIFFMTQCDGVCETLAYWRLDDEPECLTFENAFSTNFTLNARGLGISASFRMPFAVLPQWETLPEASRTQRRNHGSIDFDGQGDHQLVALKLGGVLAQLTSYTVEGWVRCSDLQPAEARWPIFGVFSDNRAFWQLCLQQISGRLCFGVQTQENKDATRQVLVFEKSMWPQDFGWHHLALVYREARVQSGEWELFVDGQSQGMVLNPLKADVFSQESFFSIGGTDQAGNGFTGQVDLWRVSDRALEQAMQLNATGPRSLACWPLDRLPDGNVDLRDLAGHHDLHPGKDGGVSAASGSACTQISFEQAPQSLSAAPLTNAGCVWLSGMVGKRSLLVAPDLGLQCDLTNSFTVEGWFMLNGAPSERFWQMVGARDDANGWMLYMQQDSDALRFHLHVSDVSQGGRIQFDQMFPNGDLLSVTNWCHLALVYDHLRNGIGVWELFLNGVSQGTLQNPAVPDRSHGWREFTLAGRRSFSNSFNGGLDCWRVSDAPLAPEQFLCYRPAGTPTLVQSRSSTPDSRAFSCGKLLPIKNLKGPVIAKPMSDGKVFVVAPVMSDYSVYSQKLIGRLSENYWAPWDDVEDVASHVPFLVKSLACYVTPFGKRYVFYSGLPTETCLYTCSDNTGSHWLKENYPLRLTLPVTKTLFQVLALGDPLEVSGNVYLPLITQRFEDMNPVIEAWVAVSHHLVSERNAARIDFSILPERISMVDQGIDGEAFMHIGIFSPGPNKLRTLVVRPDGCVENRMSQDGGLSWSHPERVRLCNGNPLALSSSVVGFGRLAPGKDLIFWQLMRTSKQKTSGMLFGVGGSSSIDGTVSWSEPELLLHASVHPFAEVLGSLTVQHGQHRLLVTQAGSARACELSTTIIDGLWSTNASGICQDGLVAEFTGNGHDRHQSAQLTHFGELAKGGFSVELWLRLERVCNGEVLLRTVAEQKGIDVVVERTQGRVTLRMNVYDGNRQVVWSTASRELSVNRLNQIAFICDVGAGVGYTWVNGCFPLNPQTGAFECVLLPERLGRVSNNTGEAIVSRNIVKALLYDRPLRSAELTAHFNDSRK